MKLVCVVIPVYKSVPSAYEIVSLNRCINQLGKYPICLVTNIGVDISFYTQKLTGSNVHYTVEYFAERYFQSIDGYNKLLLSLSFYKAFVAYRYILIHQLDVYIFRDELRYWCQQGYDYVGAPWLNEDLYRWLFVKDKYPFAIRQFHRITKGRFMKKTGNGGFSLRKTSAMISNLRYFATAAKQWPGNEDVFFSHFVSVVNPFFRVPGVDTSVRFAFDIFPSDAFQLNRRQLPFGCHGFYRSDFPHYNDAYSFWQKHIKELEAV